MRAVVGDLGPDRVLRALLADVGAGALAQRRPQVRRGRLEGEQRAERVEEDGDRFTVRGHVRRGYWHRRRRLDQRRRLDPGRADRRVADRRAPSAAAARALAAERSGPEGATRLRFVRRLLSAIVVVIGIAVALSGFTGISQLATSLLASGAIAAAIVGFAARQTLANFIAGIMLAITQPIRVGDWVTFEGNYGVVEDVSLNHTVLRTQTEQRIVIPNEKLAGGVLKNDTLKIDLVALDVSVWVPPEADVERAIAALEDETGQEVSRRRGRPVGHAAGRRQRPGEPAGQGSSRSGVCADNASSASGKTDFSAEVLTNPDLESLVRLESLCPHQAAPSGRQPSRSLGPRSSYSWCCCAADWSPAPPPPGSCARRTPRSRSPRSSSATWAR